MAIKIRYYEKPEDLSLQYDFWTKMTENLPYAWKPTLSPKLFESQKEFNPKSRCFAFLDDQLVGYMSFSGKGDFVSLGYPWVLPEYEGSLQDELFSKVYEFASSDEYGGKVFAQRFRGQWEKQIKYFESKGFEVTNRPQIIGSHYPMLLKPLEETLEFNYEFKDEFDFDLWKAVKSSQQRLTNDQIATLKEYYSSIEFDYALECKLDNQLIAYVGVTIRPDTAYSEILAPAFSKEATPYFYDIMTLLHNENIDRGVKTVTMGRSNLPKTILLEKVGFTNLTEDVMLFKRI